MCGEKWQNLHVTKLTRYKASSIGTAAQEKKKKKDICQTLHSYQVFSFLNIKEIGNNFIWLKNMSANGSKYWITTEYKRSMLKRVVE